MTEEYLKEFDARSDSIFTYPIVKASIERLDGISVTNWDETIYIPSNVWVFKVRVKVAECMYHSFSFTPINDQHREEFKNRIIDNLKKWKGEIEITG